MFHLDQPLVIHTGWVFAPFGIEKTKAGLIDLKEGGSVNVLFRVGHPLCVMLDSFDTTLQAHFTALQAHLHPIHPFTLVPLIKPPLDPKAFRCWEIKLSQSLFEQVKHWSVDQTQPRWIQCQVKWYGFVRTTHSIRNLCQVQQLQLGPVNPHITPEPETLVQPYCSLCRQRFSNVSQFLIPELAWLVMTFLNPLDIQPLKETCHKH